MHPYMANIFWSGNMSGNGLYNFYPFAPVGLLVIGIIFVISLILKGYALWNAAKRGEVWWFVALLVFNTVGILELVYLIFIAKVWPKSVTPSQAPPPSQTPSSSQNPTV